jgi:hypothetical protein
VFGCTLLKRKPWTAGKRATPGCAVANSYTFVATPLSEKDARRLSQLEVLSEEQEGSEVMALTQQPVLLGALHKPDDSTNSLEPAVSPSLTHDSERNHTSTDHSSLTGSFSQARIEDSLEAIDMLEDQLEAVAAATRSEHGSSSERRHSNAVDTQSLPSDKKSKGGKRVTIAVGQSATLRVKSSEKARPALRRSNSMTLNEKKQAQEPEEEQKAIIPLTKPKPSSTRPPPARTPVKSTKPPTIPNFELPGEAVARRLKEQREARQAQQAEAQKAAVAPKRTKSTKPLTRPNFELPGEAISRRKREEREAKLKAQEEEERSRREFKARPIMHSTSANSLVRETITSRARQGKSVDDDSSDQAGSNRSKRLSTTLGRSSMPPSIGGSHTLPRRGRNSIILPADDAHRATSSSTVASTSGQRSNVSAEEVAQQRARAREIFHRDNSFSHDRERERREREAATRLAREQAAERSRAASREWAEKKRLKEQEQKEARRRSQYS